MFQRIVFLLCLTVSIVAKSQTDDEKIFLKAVRSGDLDTVRNFLSRDDVNVNVRDDKGLAAVHLVFGSFGGPRLEVLKILLADPRTDVNARSANAHGTTALYEAAYWDSDDVEATKALLKHPDIDVNLQMPGDGWTALHRAAEWGRLEVVRVLSDDSRIDLHVKGRGGTPLAIAYRERERKVYDLLALKMDIPPYRDIWPVRCVRFLRSQFAAGG